MVHAYHYRPYGAYKMRNSDKTYVFPVVVSYTGDAKLSTSGTGEFFFWTYFRLRIPQALIVERSNFVCLNEEAGYKRGGARAENGQQETE